MYVQSQVFFGIFSMEKQNNSKPRSRLDLRIDPALYTELQTAADSLGVTLTDYVLEAIRFRLRSDGLSYGLSSRSK